MNKKKNAQRWLGIMLTLCMIMSSAFPAFAGEEGGGGGNPSVSGTAATGAASPQREYNKVVVIGLDGAGSFFEKTDTPNTDRIFAPGSGTITYDASAEIPTISGPNWGSMLHGCTPEVHTMTNQTTSCPPGIPPSFFKVVRNHYPDAALATFAQWGTMNKLIEADAAVSLNTGNSVTVTNNTAAFLSEHRNDKEPVVVMTHIDDADGAGHSYGYGKEEHLTVLRKLDGYIGQIFDAVSTDGVLDSDTLFMLVTDHGGSGTSHGGSSKTEVRVMMGVAGKGIGDKLLLNARNRDVASLVVEALGLQSDSSWSSSSPLNRDVEIRDGVGTFDISGGPVTIHDSVASGYIMNEGMKEVRYTGGYIITGESTSNTIQVASQKTKITFRNLKLQTESSPVELSGSAKADITIEGTNILKSTAESAERPGYSGLHVPEGTELTINGGDNDTLTASPSENGAGIGGKRFEKGGQITINGGQITAVARGPYGAGIGGGQGNGVERVTINGGLVRATGAYGNPDWGAGAGIGHGGDVGKGGTIEARIEVNGGTVIAKGGVTQSDGIKGDNAYHGGGLGQGKDRKGVTPATGAEVVINSGSVISDPIISSSVGKDGKVRYRAQVMGLSANQKVTAVTSDGLFTAFADENGVLSLYLPAGQTNLTINEKKVEGTVTTDGNAILYAATVLDIGKGSITFGNGTVNGFNPTGGRVTTYNNNGFVITGTTSQNAVTINGGTHDIILRGVSIEASASPIGLVSGAAVALTIEGNNTLRALEDSALGENNVVGYAGLGVPAGAKLIINGEDSAKLTVTASIRGAGIGGKRNEKGGQITINGGQITATARGPYGAGIGGGQLRGVEKVTINGGIVQATGANGNATWGSGAGIGHGGDMGKPGSVEANIEVNGGTVIAKGGITPSAGLDLSGGACHGGGLGQGSDSSGTSEVTGSEVAINGGSVITVPTMTAYPDTKGDMGYRVLVKGLISNQKVSVSAAAKEFDAFTDANGSLSIYLPAGETTVNVAGQTLQGNVKTDGSSVLQADTILDIGQGNIEFGGNIVKGKDPNGGAVSASSTGRFIVVGSTNQYSIKVTGGTHSFILRDVAVAFNGNPMEIAQGVSAELKLEGNSTLISTANTDEFSLQKGYSGIRVPEGASLTITGDSSASLYASSSQRGAGIGGNRGEKGGRITFNGGLVTATAKGPYGAGIGGSEEKGFEKITINGGVVRANGGSGNADNGSGAGIGHGGDLGPADVVQGTIEVNGGTVIAKGGITPSNGLKYSSARHGGGLGEGQDLLGKTRVTATKYIINGGSIVTVPDEASYLHEGSNKYVVYKTRIITNKLEQEMAVSVNGGSEWRAKTDDAGNLRTYLPAGPVTVVVGDKTYEGVIQMNGDNVLGGVELTGVLAISGTPVYGNTLTANTSDIMPVTGAESLSFSWYRGEDRSNPVGTGRTYQLTAEDIGSSITLVAEAGVGYEGTLEAKSQTVERAAGPEAPAAPELAAEGVTEHSVTLLTQAGIEYRVGEDGTWQSSGVFDGLNSNTEYQFYARAAQTDTQKASAASQPLTVTTKKGAYSLRIDQTGPLTWVAVGADYQKPEAKAITVTNVGTEPITGLQVKLIGANAEAFETEAGSLTALNAGQSAEVKVGPVAALPVGSYAATLSVTGENGVSASIDLKLTVAAGITQIENAALKIEQPTGGEAVSEITSLSEQFYVKEAVWTDAAGNPAAGTFGYGTVYKAAVTLTAGAGCTFTEATTVSGISEASGTITKGVVLVGEGDGNELTFEVTFPETVAEPDPESIPIVKAVVTLDAPKAGGSVADAQADATSGQHVAKETKWKTADGAAAGTSFDYGTVYEAVITLFAYDGYIFDSNTVISGVEADSSKVLSGGRELQIVVKFPATEDKPSEGVTVSGYVGYYNDETTLPQLPAYQVEIALDGTDTGVVTDETGYFELQSVASGDHTLTLSRADGIDLTLDITVEEGKDLAVSTEEEKIAFLTGDYDQSGEINGLDYIEFMKQFGKEEPGNLADYDQSSSVNGLDFIEFLRNFGKAY